MSQIAIDLDSTLYDFQTPAREGFLKLAEERNDKNLQRGAYVSWTQWRTPADVCGTDIWMEVIGLCHSAEIIEKQTPYAGSVETVNALYEGDHELIYISNRDVESLDATHDWLSKWGFPMDPDKTALVCTMESKKPYLTNCQYLIDDRPKTCVEFVYDHSWFQRWEHDILAGLHQRKAFAMMAQYNENLTDIPNIYVSPTWAGLNVYLVSKGVLEEPATISLGA